MPGAEASRLLVERVLGPLAERLTRVADEAARIAEPT